jgi:hypothetical protein
MKQFQRRVLVLIDEILGDTPTQHETSTSSVSSHYTATPMPSPVLPELQQMRNHATSREQGTHETVTQWLKTVWNM